MRGEAKPGGRPFFKLYCPTVSAGHERGGPAAGLVEVAEEPPFTGAEPEAPRDKPVHVFSDQHDRLSGNYAGIPVL